MGESCFIIISVTVQISLQILLRCVCKLLLGLYVKLIAETSKILLLSMRPAFSNRFLCDVFIEQSYNRDLFIFLYILLIIVSAMTSLKKHNDKSAFSGKSILYLNRHQTEEWKGWMQASFCPSY